MSSKDEYGRKPPWNKQDECVIVFGPEDFLRILPERFSNRILGSDCSSTHGFSRIPLIGKEIPEMPTLL